MKQNLISNPLWVKVPEIFQRRLQARISVKQIKGEGDVNYC